MIVFWLGQRELTGAVIEILRQIHGRYLEIYHDPQSLDGRYVVSDYLRRHPGSFVYLPHIPDACSEPLRLGMSFGTIVRYDETDGDRCGDVKEVRRYNCRRSDPVVWTDPDPPVYQTVKPAEPPQQSLFDRAS